MSGMSVRSIVRAAAAVAVLAASASAAHAADPKAADKAGAKPLDFSVHMDQAGTSAQAPSVKWDAEHKKWGFTLNLQQPDTRASTWNDIQAGAYYRITPSLRVGGAFALGGQQPLPGPKPGVPEAGQPQVQFETKFKF